MGYWLYIDGEKWQFDEFEMKCESFVKPQGSGRDAGTDAEGADL